MRLVGIEKEAYALFGEMRDATTGERKRVSEHVKSISQLNNPLTAVRESEVINHE